MRKFKMKKYTITVMVAGYEMSLYRDTYREVLPLKRHYDVKRIRNNYTRKDIKFISCYKGK